MANKYNTVRLAVYGSPAVELEYVNSGAPILPGMALHLAVDGTVYPEDADDPASSIPSPLLVAIENTHVGGGVSEDFTNLEAAYGINDIVSCFYGRPGDKYWVWLAPNQTCLIGNVLVATGNVEGAAYDGTFVVQDPPPPAIDAAFGVMFASEAVTTGAGESKRIIATVR